MTNTVICAKWGDKYGPEYVNRLYNMVKRNTTKPFKFICFTDNNSGICSEVETRELPSMNLPNGKERGWRKLSFFGKDANLSGNVLFIDLDVVIVSNIDDYFTMEGDFILTEHWKPSKKQGIGQTSVYRFNAANHADLYEYFMANIDTVKAEYRHEQAYVCGMLAKQNNIKFWPIQWMPSFKYKCMRTFPLNLFMKPVLPKAAKIVVFHGNPTPDQAMAGKTKGFLKGIFRHVITPQWLKDNWR
ncbi:MAG: hypothetical protein SPI34_02315 [Opitutales bacterium]|nr:hypothetical protein [Opitutales bacterium]